MTTATLIARLLELPGEIAAAEAALAECVMTTQQARSYLKDNEAIQLDRGQVQGKNAEERAANLRIRTSDLRENMEDLEAEEVPARLALSALQTELSVLKTVARLMARETD